MPLALNNLFGIMCGLAGQSMIGFYILGPSKSLELVFEL